MNQQDFFNRYSYDLDKDHLGEGGFGKVFKAFDDILDREVAIKISEVKRGYENISLKNEVALADKIPTHKNIAHYEECFRFKTPHGTFDYGILQYYKTGNLSKLINDINLDYNSKENIALGIIEGIKHLHLNKIVHRDLKSSNILIAKRGTNSFIPKIADFGLSKQFSDLNNSKFSNSFNGGSLLYAAPEQLSQTIIRKNVDFWSLGVILFELFTGKLPFYPSGDINSETGRIDLVKQITTANIPKQINKIREPWKKVITSCLIIDNNKRIKGINEIQTILSNSNIYNLSEKSSKNINNNEVNEETIIIEKEKIQINEKQKNKEYSRKKYFYVLPVFLLISFLFYKTIQSNKTQDLLTFEDKGLYGYKDQKENIIISAQYNVANAFKNGEAIVSVNDSTYTIDRKGNIINIINIVAENTNSYQNEKPDNITQENYNDLQESNRSRDNMESKTTVDSYSKKENSNTTSKPKNESTNAQLDLKAWQKAQKENTINAYRLYLEQYPNGIYYSEAKQALTDAINAEKSESPSPTKIINDNMIFVKGSEFTMGCINSNLKDCEKDSPSHSVKLRDFYISKYEVTQAQWTAIMGSNPSYFKNCDDCPVEMVNWSDANTFIQKLNKLTKIQYRLPTEAEWEYVAKGGHSQTHENYSGSGSLNDIAWNTLNSNDKTNTIGSKKPNILNVYDMSGNISEWCQDWYSNDYYEKSKSTNPKGPYTGRQKIIRGGAWNNSSKALKVTSRSYSNPNTKSQFVGLRLAI